MIFIKLTKLTRQTSTTLPFHIQWNTNKNFIKIGRTIFEFWAIVSETMQLTEIYILYLPALSNKALWQALNSNYTLFTKKIFISHTPNLQAFMKGDDIFRWCYILVIY